MSDTRQSPLFLTTKEVADVLRVKERKVYDLAASNEIPHVKRTGKLLFPTGEFYAWLGQSPEQSRGTSTQAQVMRPNVLSGSHDPLLEWAIRQSGCGLALQLDGSLAGLNAFESGQSMASGLHVIDPSTGDYNRAEVQVRFSGQNVVLVRWATRQQGLIVKAGNPLKIKGFSNLKGLTIAQRQAGAGAAIVFDLGLKEAGLRESDLKYTDVCRTENESIAAVAGGQADAAPGLQAMAVQFGLGFVPTKIEHFDLLVCRKAWFDEPFQNLMKFTRSSEFQTKAAQLAGYSIDQTWNVVWSA